jgi:hypothetical protein
MSRKGKWSIHARAKNIEELMYSLGNLAEAEGKKIEDFTQQELVDEAKWVLSTFYEEGHMLNEKLREGDADERAWARNEIRKLKKFIADFDQKGKKNQETVFDMNIKYFKGKVVLEAGLYERDGNLALSAKCAATGEKVLTFTVNVPGVSLGPSELLIKDWSENEGALDFLLENDLVESTNRAVLTGYAMAPVVRMTDQLIHILDVHV